MRQLIRSAMAAAAVTCLFALPASAQTGNYPDRAVHIIVPYPAGGTADVLPRLIAQKLMDKWGQSVVIENLTGAGGNIGADRVAKAAPDGYTLMATPPGPLVVNHNLYKNLPFDPTQFTPITTIAAAPNVLAVRKDFPAKTAEEFLAYARANPGKITAATQGNGTTSHLTGAMYANQADTQLTFIPYRGTSPALAALIGGQVDLFFDNIGSMYAQHAAGNARILAVTTAKRSPLLPDVPTIAEAGLPGFASSTWFGLVAPPNTPAAIADKIHDDVVEVLNMPDVKQKFRDAGVAPVGESRKEAGAFMEEERARWKQVIDAAHVAIN